MPNEGHLGGDVLRLVVIVDDERPVDGNYRVQLLAPVSAEVGQFVSFDVYWRGQQPPGWRTMRRAPLPS